MTNDGRPWHSSIGRWKPLFKFSWSTTVVALNDISGYESEGPSRSGGEGNVDGSQKVVQQASGHLSHSWGGGTLVLNASGKAPLLGPPRSILLKADAQKVKKPSKARFMDGLVTEWVEPPHWDIVTDVCGGIFQRAAKRKATGFNFKIQEADQNLIAELVGELFEEEHAMVLPGQLHDEDTIVDASTQDRPNKTGDAVGVEDHGDDDLSGFGSDDEFEELEVLAAKNAQLNREATKLATPIKLTKKDKPSDPGPFPKEPAPHPAKREAESPRSSSGFGDSDDEAQPKEPKAQPKASESPRSSFGDSSDEERNHPKSGPHPVDEDDEDGMQPSSPSAPAKPPARDDDASSFASSSDGEQQTRTPHPVPVAAASSGHQPINAPVAPKLRRPPDSPRSSFASSSDEESAKKKR